MKYRIRIEEVLSRFVRVEADSHQEAEKKVEKMYKEGQVVLGAEDFLSVEFL
jgi:hypothetical protein